MARMLPALGIDAILLPHGAVCDLIKVNDVKPDIIHHQRILSLIDMHKVGTRDEAVIAGLVNLQQLARMMKLAVLIERCIDQMPGAPAGAEQHGMLLRIADVAQTADTVKPQTVGLAIAVAVLNIGGKHRIIVVFRTGKQTVTRRADKAGGLHRVRPDNLAVLVTLDEIFTSCRTVTRDQKLHS